MLLRTHQSSASRWLSPWLIAVCAAFILGAYLGSVNTWRKNALGAFGGTNAVRSKGDRSTAAAYSGGMVAGARGKKRRFNEADEVEPADDPAFEGSEEEEEENTDTTETPRTRKGGKKSSSKGRSSSKKSKKTSSKKKAPPKEEEGGEDEEEGQQGGNAEAGGVTGAVAGAKMGVVEAPPKPDSGAPHPVRFHDGQVIQVFPHIDHGAGGRNWWPSVDAGWEGDTLQAMRFFLTKHKEKNPGKKSIQIDFGCWVGPTILFASQYADKIYALEPDPAAHREAFHNVALNPQKAAKIDLRRLCISDKPGQLTLWGSPGDSMSSAFPDRNGGANRKDYQSWNVECTTLDRFIEAEGIDTDEIALIKVDTEGHESPIMWQLKDWLKEHPKITVALSVHAFQYPDLQNPEHAQLQERLRQVIISFKHVVLTHNGEEVDKNAFSVGGYCYLCGLILTNQEPSDLGVSSWKEAFTPKA